MGLGRGYVKIYIYIYINLISLTIFWVVQKEKNCKVLEGIEDEMSEIRDRWMHYFDFLILGYDIYKKEDFGNIINILIKL